MTRKRKPAPPDASRLPELFAENGPLASRKIGYGYRPQQLGFARAVEKTLKERGVLLADAPTGTGKSAAYLAPAILDAADPGGRPALAGPARLPAAAGRPDLRPLQRRREVRDTPHDEGETSSRILLDAAL